jgi:heme/copper-type cytochrome/quinol oxidase subunit 1
MTAMSSNSIPISETVSQVAERKPLSEILHEWVITVDHKRLGLMYIGLALLFLALGGLEAAIMRIQLAVPHGHFVSPQVFNRMFTMHGTTMIFFLAMTILFGFGVYLVPLMIGTRDMAFPRLNAWGFWMSAFGGLLLYFSFIGGEGLSGAGTAPDVGWWAYAPLTSPAFSKGHSTDYWTISLLVAGFGTLATAVNFVATILSMRCPGMTLGKMPLLCWMYLVTGGLLLFTITPLTAAQLMLMIDRYLGGHFFDTQAGGSAVMWMAHHMFTVGMASYSNAFFVLTSMAIAVPTGIKIFNWLGTMWGGQIRYATPMLFCLGFIFQFLIAGLTGVMLGAAPFNWQLSGSYFVIAHFHYVIVGGILFALFGAFYYWYSKMTGRMLNETLGKWHFWLFFIGFHLTFDFMHGVGILGMPRRIYTYEPNRGWETWNMIVTVGVLFQAAAMLCFAFNLFWSYFRGRATGNDPWDAWTLEWSTSSPPPAYNFAAIPEVKSRRPLWDLKHPEDPDWRYE